MFFPERDWRYLSRLKPLALSIDTETPVTCVVSGQYPVLGVRASFSNVGNAAAPAFTLEINGVQKLASGLDAGAEDSYWVPGFVLGVNQLKLDVTDQIIESDETNNQLSQTLPLPTPLPTCTPSAP